MSQFLPLDDVKTYIRKLAEIPFLESFRGKYVEEMFRASELREYEAGETIITEGALDRTLYFLLMGEVKVVKEDVEIARIYGYGEIFGELALMDNRARFASIVAVSPCYCLSVDPAFMDRLTPNQQVACFSVIHRICAHVLSSRLKAATEELARLRKQKAPRGKARKSR